MTDFTGTVRDLLTQSRQAHLLYQQLSPRMVPSVSGAIADAGDKTAASAALGNAARLRAQAETIDPAFSDPAWADEPAKFVHRDLMRFYVQQLSK